MIYGMPQTKFFETFVALATQKGLSPSVAAEEAGLNRSAVTTWKKGRIPGEATLSKLTAYFGVTRQYLLEGPPVETETENKVELDGRTQRVNYPATEPDDTSLDFNEFPFQRRRFEYPSFIKLALNLLKIYYPHETEESLAHKLKMNSKVLEALEDDNVVRVPIEWEWYSRFYSLLEDKSVRQISRDLGMAADILNSERSRLNETRMPQIIWEYMYQKKLEFELVKESHSHPVTHEGRYQAVVKLKDSEKHWIFQFYEFEEKRFMQNQRFIQSRLILPRGIPNIERFILVFIYVIDYTSDGEFTKFEEWLYRTGLNEINTILSTSKLFLLQIDSTTREIMKEKQVDLSSLTDLGTN